ncbi:MAG: alpha-L-fucosidase [Phycisphaerales bacterium]|nr:alpha-L-fucosidase [Phycisphaerales bacterium]
MRPMTTSILAAFLTATAWASNHQEPSNPHAAPSEAVSDGDPARRATVLPNRFEFARVLMGTKATVTLYAPDANQASDAAAAAFDRLAALDEVMSDYRSDSELMRLCAKAGTGPVRISDDLLEVLSTADRVRLASAGAFDVRVGPLVALWRTARQTGQLPDADHQRIARQLAAGDLSLDPAARTASLSLPGMKLDLGGIGKGFAAAKARDLLVARGFASCMVALSGDIAVGNPPPGQTAWRLDLDGGVSQRQAILLPPYHSVSTAGDVEQSIQIAGARYSHIIDPRIGMGSDRRGAATVISTDGALADALDDALYLHGPAAAPTLLNAFPGVIALVEEKADADRIERFSTPDFPLADQPAGAMSDTGWLDPDNAPPAGFTALFNGRDLTNWQGLVDGPPVVAAMTPDQRNQLQQQANDDMAQHWRAHNGVLKFDGRGNSLQTVKNYRDFELYVDWRIEKAGDSGIYLRGSPQVQIWDNPIGSGGIYNNRQHASQPLKFADRPVGEWNRFHIIMRGDHVTVFLNDVLVVDDTVIENYWEPGRPIYATGPIELQNHGNNLEFKNIFIRELPSMPDAADHDGYRMAWWRDARFGMFIHWGLYAIPAGEWNGKPTKGIGEWIMHDLQIPASEYETLAPKFNPTKFDAEAWVKMAADAGVRYIVITSKHHDGFCLFDSAHTTYDIMDATPFRRDIMKELSEACYRHGVRMCWYHSIMDWHQPDAQTPETFGPKYVPVLRAQVTELLTKYGNIGAMWFDGEWDQKWNNDMGKELYALCRQLQPWTIVNNRVGKGRQGMAGHTAAGDFPGDFGTPEQEIPATGLSGQDWESCMTMNDTWGFKTSDHNWKSPETLIRMLIETTSKGGNFLLNVGPTAEGLMPQESIDRFATIGRWMKANSDSIYHAGASPFPHLPWGRCTSKPGTLYFHIFDWPLDRQLHIPGLLNSIRSAKLLNGGQPIIAIRESTGWRLDLPQITPDPYSTVIAVEIAGAPAIVPIPLRPEADGSLTLKARDAVIHGSTPKLEGPADNLHIGFWTDESDTISWQIAGLPPGHYIVDLTYACDDESKGATFDVRISSSQLSGEVFGTKGWNTFTTIPLGEIDFTGGPATVTVTPTSKPGLGVMNLQNLRLVPAK